MAKNNLKVVVDYYTNSCSVTGIYEGKQITITRPITGFNEHMGYLRNYAGKSIKNKVGYMEYKMEQFKKENPNFKYYEKIIENVDPLIFSALERWDMMGYTNYAMDYLKSIVQNYNIDKSYSKSKEEKQEESKIARKDALDKLGIDISYNVALLNTASAMSITDKIRGIKVAEAQAKLYGAKVTKNFRMNDRGQQNSSNNTSIQNEQIDINEKEANAINTDKPELTIAAENSNIKNETSLNVEKNANLNIKKESSLNVEDKNDLNIKNEKRNTEILNKPTRKTKNAVIKKREREEKKIAYESAKLQKADKNKELKLSKQNSIAKKTENTIQRRELTNNQQNRYQADKNIIPEANNSESLKAEQERKNKIKELRAEKNKKELERIEQARAEAQKIIEDERKRKTPLGFFKGIADKVKNSNSNTVKSNLMDKKERWGRKIADAKDSIKNKQFIKPENAKKVAVTGVATLLAAGSLAAAINVSNATDNYKVPITNNEENSKATEKINYSTPDIPEIYSNAEKACIDELETTKEAVTNSNSSENKKITKKQEKQQQDEQTINKKDVKKDNKQKIKEFKEFAYKEYMSSFVIGEEQKTNILKDSYYTENPDGTGNVGFFKNKEKSNLEISHINIVTKDGKYKKVDYHGENLADLLNQCTDYSVHYINKETGCGYGFVQKSRLEQVVNEAIDAKLDELMDSILNDNIQATNNSKLDIEDWML